MLARGVGGEMEGYMFILLPLINAVNCARKWDASNILYVKYVGYNACSQRVVSHSRRTFFSLILWIYIHSGHAISIDVAHDAIS